MPTVSIALPTYNRAYLLPSVLKTILDQDYRDFELVIVDDGSTDNTAQVLQDLHDPRIRYLPLPQNMGIGYARNHGLQVAQGKYLAFADSDDPWLPGKLSREVSIMEQHPEIDALFTNYLNINEIDGSRVQGFTRCRTAMSRVDYHRTAEGIAVVDRGLDIGILERLFIHLPTLIGRRENTEKYGGFTPTLRGAEDLEFHWRYAFLGAQFAFIDDVTIERHRNETSVTAAPIRNMQYILAALLVCLQLSREHHRPDRQPYLYRAIIRAYRNLIRSYGLEGQRSMALKMFQESLPYGLSPRNALFTGAAILGPSSLRLLHKLRQAAPA